MSYDHIHHLGGLSHMRERPGMYVGDYMSNEYNSALMHLIREIVDNSTDEFLAGHATQIKVTLDSTQQLVTVEDDGRGIPFGPTTYVDPVTKQEFPTDSLYMATGIANTGGKYSEGKSEGQYLASKGLHGAGSKIVCALSTKFKATSVREGKQAFIAYQEGEPMANTHITDTKAPRGTRIEFIPDQTILPFRYKHEHIRRYMQEVAYLNAGVQLLLQIDDEPLVEYCEPNGIEALLDAEIKERGSPVIARIPKISHGAEGENQIEVSLAFVQGSNETYHPYVNGGKIEQASTPVVAIRKVLAQAVARYTKEYAKLTKKEQAVNITTDDFRSGLICVIKILHTDPAYDSQTKTKFVNPDVANQIATTFPDIILTWLVANAPKADLLVRQALTQAMAREAANKARKAVLDKAPTRADDKAISLNIYTPPLSKDPTERDLYLFEGQSASNSLIKASKFRNPETGRLYKDTVGVLALKGVPLNPQEHTLARIQKNVELATLIHVLGLNTKDPDDLSNLQFNRVIIASDMDAGGSLISVLLVTFFLFHFPKIISEGRLFRVDTPRWEITDLKTKAWHPIYITEGVDAALGRLGYNQDDAGKRFDLRINKGLGSLSDKGVLTLVENPKLVSIQSENIPLLTEAFKVFNGSDYVPQRKALIFEEGLTFDEEVIM